MCIIKFIIYLFVPTVIFSLYSIHIGFFFQIINFDIFFSAFLLSSAKTSIRILFFTTIYIFALALQIWQIVEYIYGLNFHDIPIHILSFGSWPKSANVFLAAFLFLLIFFLICTKRLDKKFISPLPIIFVLVLFLISDAVLSASFFYPKDTYSFPNIVGSPTLGEYRKLQFRHGEFTKWDEIPNSYSAIKKIIDKMENSNARLLIVTVESLGISVKKTNQEVLEKSIKEYFKDYNLVMQYREKTKGSTLNGELRLLCGIKDYGNLYGNIKYTHEFEECIPNYARKIGLTSLAAHANTSSFYNRKEVYPAIGFQEFISSEVIKEKQDKFISCSDLFSVACDGHLTKLALDHRFVSSDALPNIIYVLTIDSHLPLRTLKNISTNEDIDLTVYIYYEAIKKSLSQIAESIKKSKYNPDYLVIVGDHPPPFVEMKFRSQFEINTVPVFIFKKILK
jgi:hypothetical protein